MPMRMSGMISGLDTDSLISSLVSAKRLKVTKTTGEKTKLSWKQEKWKDLNKQLVSLRSTALNMRYTSSWQKKTTSVSDSTKASVITGSGAVNSVQSLKITQLAKSGYMTGGQITALDSEGNKMTALSTMRDLGFTGGENGSDAVINITTGGETKSLTFNADSTISDVLTAIKAQGLNASFDEKNQRFFISSKTTGADSDFAITASDSNGTALLEALKISTYDDTAKKALTSFTSYSDADITAEALKRAQSNAESYKIAYNYQISTQKARDDAKKAYDEGMDNAELSEEQKTALQKALDDAEAKLTSATEKATAAREGFNLLGEDAITFKEDGTIASIDSGKIEATSDIVDQVSAEFATRKAYAESQLAALQSDDKPKSTVGNKITGQDAIINLNGVDFTNSTNVFEVNGLTITALEETGEEEVKLTTDTDTSGIYGMVKDFLTKYNTIINEMDKLYNAESSSKYTPLTDEEKEALSDAEVEKYENKIKDGLFRSDQTLSGISSALTSIMSAGIEVGDKKYFLSDFGINTQSYLEAEPNTSHSYHIDGDSDDTVSSSNADKLKGLIASDPDVVTSFFTKLGQSLYDKMDSLSSRVAGSRSYGSFYYDQTMNSDYKSYDTKISELEQKANDYEDRLYSKFSKMEAAMAKLQSKTSALTGLFGTSQ